ncbi:MAG TPA: 50S ribosomal protein L29 [Piscirickettsiaceae bacterium]|nr:50S ribosomal protein L29 [Piscirickettsiaceae bacterium]HIQ39838.1 50S ribosomal protein L29 [Sulfurivirga caldicuralii]
MDIKSLREKNVSELNDMLKDLRKEQFNLRMQHATGQLQNTAELRKIRRNIARIKTLIREKVSA